MSRKRANTRTAKLFDKKMFLKFFVITMLIATVVFTGGMTWFSQMLDTQIMDKGGSSASTITSKVVTAEDIDVMIEGEGFFAQDYADSKRINILLLGTTEENLSDTMMLASFDPDTKKVDVISVPRDTYHYREGQYGGYLKLNSVVQEGIPALCDAIHEILQGIPINYYAQIDYDGITNIVNAMDGVPMYVPQDMYYSSPEQNLLIDLSEGEQILDGDEAIQLLRFRKGYINGDLGRVETQQEFLKCALERALGLNLPNVAKTTVENLDSDLTLRTILYIADKAKGMNMENVTMQVIPGTDDKDLEGSPLSFFFQGDDAEVEAMLRAIYDPENYPAGHVSPDGFFVYEDGTRPEFYGRTSDGSSDY